jgi:hypothetical protein
MRPRAKKAATRPSRKDPPTSGSPPGRVQDDETEEALDICLDNDLGAEWTGNADCIERVVKKSRRKL